MLLLITKYLYTINYTSNNFAVLVFLVNLPLSKDVLIHPFIQEAFSGVCISPKGVYKAMMSDDAESYFDSAFERKILELYILSLIVFSLNHAVGK